MHEFPIDTVREAFPALVSQSDAGMTIFLDNPAGTQVPRRVADAVAAAMLEASSNLGGYFTQSRTAEGIWRDAHAAMADMLGASTEREIVIGPCMTALTLHMSRSIGRELSPGDEIIVTRDEAGSVSTGAIVVTGPGTLVEALTTGGEDDAISSLAFFAPSMAIFFLMFAAFTGTRSILTEKTQGTLSRLLSTPTSYNQILAGKIGGTFLTGILQFTVLVVASRFIFNLNWGNSLPGLILMMFAVVAAATSLGALVAAFAKDANQANVIGSAITLTFAALGGNFFPAENLPDWLQPISRLTINRWGLDGFTDLTIAGLGLSDILLEAGVLLGIALLLFVLAVQSFQRQIK